MRTIIGISLAAGLIAIQSSVVADSGKASSLRAALSKSPAAELPARAADLVKAVKSSERGFTTVDVVKGAAGINPAAAPAVVAAVAKALPDMASIAAGAAAEELPKEAVAITKAAVGAAPGKTAKIVAAVCRVVPNQYYQVALAASQVAPGSEKEILRAIASVFPELRPGIDQALNSYAGRGPSVGTVLDSTKSVSGPVPDLISAGNSRPQVSPVVGVVRGPIIGPPFIPLSSTPTNINPSTSGTVPTGGRNYAQP